MMITNTTSGGDDDTWNVYDDDGNDHDSSYMDDTKKISYGCKMNK